jgi:ubiquinone/menaquinone biosynthesis C-methylase UbiE
MLLSRFERFYVNSWLRHGLQRPLELAILNRLHPFPQHAHWLDVGCGNGGALAAIAKRTQPLSLTGVDADGEQIERARQRFKHASFSVILHAADAAAMPLPAQTYDAVSGFGVLHHLEHWPKGVAEIARVLRHGGVYYGLEFYAPLLENPIFQKLFPHPAHRFTHEDLCAELEKRGLRVMADKPILGLMGFVVARRVAGEAYD